MLKNTGTTPVSICLLMTFVFWLTSVVTPGFIHVTMYNKYKNVSVYTVYLVTIKYDFLAAIVHTNDIYINVYITFYLN